MKRTPEEKLLNPKPESKIAAAQEFGIDLSLLVENLRLTPDQRVRNLQKSMRNLHRILQDVKTGKIKNNDRNRTGS